MALSTERASRVLPPLVWLCWLLVLAVLLEPAAPEPASTGPPSPSTQTPAPSPQPKEKRSQEDIMFGNQQNKPASGMVDDFFQSIESAASKNVTHKATPAGSQASDSPGASTSSTGDESSSPNADLQEHSQQQQVLPDLPDRLDYYDYVQPESTDQQSSSLGAMDEDDLDEEDAERNAYVQRDLSSFRSQKLLRPPPSIDRDELGDYPSSSEDEYESPSSSSRSKRGVFRRLHSPLEDLLSPSGGPLRRRRASRSPMRLKRDATSNELLSWLALLQRGQGPRRGDKVAFQELQGLETEPLELTSDSGYLYEPITEEDLEEEGLPASILETLPLPEEGPSADSMDWDVPIRAPPRRRSFYPLDYRYVLLPGSRKRSIHVGPPGGRFGAMREVNRWPSEPQAGHWGHIPQHLRLPMRRAPPQESDTDRLNALAYLLASPGVSYDSDLDQDRRRRRRSPRPAQIRG